MREDEQVHLDFESVQREAAAGGETLPPATLRAMLLKDAARAAAARGEDAGTAAVGACAFAARRPLPTKLAESDLSLAQFPSELLLALLGWMDAPTLSICALVSRELNVLARSEELWHALVRRRYEPIAWALPADALTTHATAAFSRPWFALYVSLAMRGHEGDWRCLAAAKATSGGRCWIILEGCIYDVTEFMHRHPGMVRHSARLLPATLSVAHRCCVPPSQAASLELFGGTDATEAFRQVPHSPLAHRVMRSLEVEGPDGAPLRLPDEGSPAALLAASLDVEPRPASNSWLDETHVRARLVDVVHTGAEWLRWARGR